MATRTIGTEIVLSGEKQFNDAMKGVNNNLKNLKSDMALTTAEFADNADSVEALTAKQKLLQSSVDQHRAKVDALKEMYEKQKKQYGENSAAADKYKIQLNQATVAMLKEESALKKTEEALEDAESEANKYIPITQKLASALKKPGEAFTELREKAIDSAKQMPVISEAMDIASVSAKGLKKAAEGVGKALPVAGKAVSVAGKGIGVTFKGIGTAASGLAMGVGAFTGAAAAGVAAIAAGGVAAMIAMTNMAKEAAEAAKAASEAGEKLTENQQQWLDYSNNLDNLDAAVSKAKGALAGMLLPALNDLSTKGADFLNNFADAFSHAGANTEKQTEVIARFIKVGVTQIKKELPKYLETGKALITGLLDGMSEIGPDLLNMGLDMMMDFLDLIFEFAPKLADMGIQLVEKLIEGLVEKGGPDLLQSAIDMVLKITMGLAKAAPELIPLAGQLILTLVTGLLQNLPALLTAGLELTKGIITGLCSGDLEGSGQELLDQLISTVKDCISIFLDIGSEIVQLLKEGITEAWDKFTDWFNSLFDGFFKNKKIDVEVNGNANIDGSHVSGLNYVPFDGYLAKLHRGEAVLTASEAAAYRRGETKSNAKTFNMTINTQTISKEELDSIVSYVNRKLGDIA